MKKVADQIKEGPYANMWKLKDSWKLDKEGETEEKDEKPDLGWDDDDDEDDFEEVM